MKSKHYHKTCYHQLNFISILTILSIYWRTLIFTYAYFDTNFTFFPLCIFKCLFTKKMFCYLSLMYFSVVRFAQQYAIFFRFQERFTGNNVNLISYIIQFLSHLKYIFLFLVPENAEHWNKFKSIKACQFWSYENDFSLFCDMLGNGKIFLDITYRTQRQ